MIDKELLVIKKIFLNFMIIMNKDILLKEVKILTKDIHQIDKVLLII